MINFLHLSALLSLTSALCLQRNAKKMNGANISPSFYSFFIFFSIFVFVLLLLPSFPSFLSFSSSCYFFFVCSSCLYFCFALSFLVFLFSFLLFSFLLFYSSFSIPPFSVPPFSVPLFLCSSFYPFSEECDLQQKFHIDHVKHLPKFYAHFLKARFLFET